MSPAEDKMFYAAADAVRDAIRARIGDADIRIAVRTFDQLPHASSAIGWDVSARLLYHRYQVDLGGFYATIPDAIEHIEKQYRKLEAEFASLLPESTPS